LNVVAETVPAELMVGNAKTTNVLASATAANALLFFNFIFSPTLQWHPNDAIYCDHYLNVL
jgi:hypothetical protein